MPDATAVNLVNTALGLLGQEPVVDLSDASLAQSNAAVKLLRVLELARDAVLGRHGWTCALAYVTLQPAIIPNDPADWRYPTRYLVPADCIRIWEIGGIEWSGSFACWQPRWQVGTTEANGSPQFIIRASAFVDTGDGFGLGYLDDYVAGWSSAPSSSDPAAQTDGSAAQQLGPLDIAYVRRADWLALDGNLIDAIATDAAARSCYSITGDSQRAQALKKEAEGLIQLAVGSEAGGEGMQPAWGPSIPLMLRAIGRL